MLTGRKVLAATLIIAAISLIASTLSLTRDDARELRGNSFGVRAHGFRGLFEIIEELQVPVDRVVGPPTNAIDAETTLVFIGPDNDLLAIEPAYVLEIAEWVRNGGRVVYAPARAQDDEFDGPRRRMMSRRTSRPFLELLGVDFVRFSTIDVDGIEFERPRQSGRRRDEVEFREVFMRSIDPETSPATTISVRRVGDRLPGAEGIQSFAVPALGFQVMDLGRNADPTGQLVFDLVEGSQVAEKTVAASFPVGSGQVVVFSDPSLAQNRFVANADNAPFLVNAITGSSTRVVFDEFYHGLAVRGNPLVLLRRPHFTLLLCLTCLLIAAYSWRQSVRLGPAWPEQETSRRSVSEYVEAMARLFARSKKPLRFLLSEHRDGLLWTLRSELGLPPAKNAAESIATVLKKRDPERAQRFIDAVARFDELISNPSLREPETLDAMQRGTSCR